MGKKKLVLLVISLFFALLLLEIFLRLFLPQDLNIYQYNKDYVFEFRPGAGLIYNQGDFKHNILINSEGFRDKERNYSKTNKHRVAMLGDSFVSGLEVDEPDRVSNIIEKRLNSNGDKFEVFNFGVNGYSTEQEFLQLKNRVINYDPDLVVLNFYVGNDQVDNYYREIFSFDNQTLSINKKRDFNQRWPRSVFYFLTGKSYLISLLFNNYLRIKSFFTPAEFEVGAISGISFVNTSLLRDDNELSRNVWSKTNSLIILMNAFLKDRDKKFIVVIIPDRVQEDTLIFNALLENYNLSESQINRLKPQNELKKFLENSNIIYLDLLPVLEKNSSEFHYSGDFHWNEKGHKVVADALMEKLIKEKLVV